METHGKMKISELKENKTTRRATRNFDSEGRRIYEFFEYEISYDTTYEKNRRDRFCSKIIDMIPFTLLFVFILHKPLIVASSYTTLNKKATQLMNRLLFT